MLQDQDVVQIGFESLDSIKVRDLVSDDRAGAISSFIGTTRCTFQGKSVLRLEYEAYIPMAKHAIQ
jgi:molybdopterin synthase catalytic subunit